MKRLIIALLLIVAFTRAANAQPSETVLFNFDSASNGGTVPIVGLLPGPNGSFYGTTDEGGTYGAGTVFQLKPPVSGGAWTNTTIFSFNGTTTGSNPDASLISDAQGNLYGTTVQGGTTDCWLGGVSGPTQFPYKCGLVFKLAPGENNQWTFTMLYGFHGIAGTYHDGSFPSGTILRDARGNLYGTTQFGSHDPTSCQGNGCGTVFKLTPSGTETLLYSFKGTQDGNWPGGGLIMDSKGVLYGTTTDLPAGPGTVFSLSPPDLRYVCPPFDPDCPPPPPPPNWSHNTLHSFTAVNDGEVPMASLYIDASGNLYGTTQGGGAYFHTGGLPGAGTAFKLTPPVPPATTWTETVIHSFGDDTFSYFDGFNPTSNLIADASGNLYGATNQGGQDGAGNGTVFKLTPAPGGGWNETQLYVFQGPPGDGHYPNAVVFGTDGNLYGTTSRGGSYPCPPVNAGCGTVFQVKLK